MKTLSLIIATFFLAVAVSSAATTGSTHVLNRISNETGTPVDTLQTEKSSTGLGYGDLENANLLANASGQSFDTIVGKFQAGEGWGKIAHDYGLNLGKLVSAAHRSSQATLHAQSGLHGKSSTTHGNSGTHSGNGHTLSPKGGVKGGPQIKGHGHGGR